MNKITIIGSGSFGCALAYVLSKNSNNIIKIWSYTEEETNLINNEHKCMFLKNFKLDEKIKCYKNYEDALFESDYVILVTPSSVFYNTCKEIKKYITNQKIIIATKGLVEDKLLSEIVKEELDKDANLIYGPSHAEQIIKDMPTYVNYYGNEDIKLLFESEYFKLEKNNDLVGMQIGASLKNIISLVVGLLEGNGYESNTISYIITKGLEEIKNIAISLGALDNTLYGLSGLGDLLTTSFSNDSRNKRAGLLLSTGKNIDEIKKEIGMTIEGLDALNSAIKIINKNDLNCTIIKNLYNIIYNNESVDKLLK